MEKIIKKCSDSRVIMTELVLPNDTNPLNNLMGGRLMHWMDIAAGVAAMKHSNCVIVTASVDNISFSKPVELGNVVTLEAFVTRAFNTSMEVFIKVTSDNVPNNLHFQTNTAFFTFVAVDQNGQPQQVPEVVPETEEEIKLFDGALRRRQLRLVLSGRMKPKEAIELKSIFYDENS